MKPICVVICNFNKKDYVIGAIESVQSTAGELADILVVDNASTDGSVAQIHQRFPYIKVEVLRENIGGSGGFAHGMSQAKEIGYRYIALLDNDAVVKPDTLAKMMDLLENNSSIGVVGPAICKMDAPEIVQEVGANISLHDASFNLNFAGESYSSIAKGLIDCDYVPACCLMTKSEVIEKVGVFDVEFFLYWDDIDWCVRVKDAGWRVVAQPQIQALHKGGGANATNTLPRYYYWRNKLRFFAKHQARYDPNQFKHFLKRSLVRNVTFQYLSQTTELLVAMQRGLHDAANAVSGRYQGYEFPERATGKQKMVESMVLPGVYFLDLSAVLNSNISEEKKHNSLCRFVISCGQFSASTHRFEIDQKLYDTLSKSVKDWPKTVTIKSMQELSAAVRLKVVPHLFDITSTVGRCDELLTDLFWNFIPSTISGATALKIATELETAHESVDKFFAREL